MNLTVSFVKLFSFYLFLKIIKKLFFLKKSSYLFCGKNDGISHFKKILFKVTMQEVKSKLLRNENNLCMHKLLIYIF